MADNIFKEIKKDMARFKSKYITPEAFESKAPEMREAYIKAIDDFMKTPQFKKFVRMQARNITQDAIRAIINSESMRKHLENLLAEEFKKGINIVWK